jgi:uncharacterized membrane protein
MIQFLCYKDDTIYWLIQFIFCELFVNFLIFSSFRCIIVHIRICELYVIFYEFSEHMLSLNISVCDVSACHTFYVIKRV